MLLTLDSCHSYYVHHLEGVLYQKWGKKRPLSEKCNIFPLSPVCSVNLAHWNVTFQKVYIGCVCGGGDSDAIIERRKRYGTVVLLSAIKTIDSLCPQLLDAESKNDENLWLLSNHTTILHPFIHYHLPKEPFKTFSFLLLLWVFSHRHTVCVYILYTYLHFTHKKSEISFLPSKNQFSP